MLKTLTKFIQDVSLDPGMVYVFQKNLRATPQEIVDECLKLLGRISKRRFKQFLGFVLLLAWYASANICGGDAENTSSTWDTVQIWRKVSRKVWEERMLRDRAAEGDWVFVEAEDAAGESGEVLT